MLPIIILFISVYLDGFLTLFLPYISDALSIFTPMLTIVSIFIIYPFYRKKEKQYFITLFVVGIIYDLLYTNLLFYDAIIFIVLGFVIKYIYKNLDISHIKVSLYMIGIIALYEFIFAFFIILFNLVPMSFPRVFYKISHSILLNIIYTEVLLTIIRHLPKRLKRIDIN